MDDEKKMAFRAGMVVFLLLAVLTIGEFLIGRVAFSWWMPLLGIAIFKAVLIIRDYMHIGRLFAADEDEVPS
jgi:hypothetical protein